MIVRDEEHSLARCIESVRGVVDEIVVVDTGSHDATVAVAQAAGAQVGHFAWRDDFAAARNAALDRTHAEWVLVLDADEELVGAGARAVLERFATEHASLEGRVGRVEIRNVTPAGESRALVSRLFPNDGRHRYAGRVHEQIECEGRAPLRADTGLVVLHHGYAPQELARGDKLARNRRLLERELGERPDDGYLWWQLGRTHALAGEHERALASLERALERCPDGASWGIEALENGASSLRELGRPRQALELLAQVEEEARDRADTQFLIALLALDLGDLRRAEAGFARCIELGRRPAGASETSLAVQSASACNLGVMQEVLGRPERARDWYRLALSLEAGHAAAREGLARLAAGVPSALPSGDARVNRAP